MATHWINQTNHADDKPSMLHTMDVMLVESETKTPDQSALIKANDTKTGHIQSQAAKKDSDLAQNWLKTHEMSLKNPAKANLLDILMTEESSTYTISSTKEPSKSTHKDRIKRIEDPATMEACEAAYVKAWIEHIEQWGNQHARELKSNVKGKLQLLVVLLPDGNIKKISILRSSGQTELDEQAVQIAYQAAPYPPFNPEMQASLDMLEIVRTWEFNPL